MSSPIPRRLILSALIVTFWLVMMGLLVSRQQRGIQLPTGIGGSTDNGPSFTAMAISTATGQRVGTIRIYQVAEERHGHPGQRVGLSAELALRILGKSSDLAISGGIWRPGEPAELLPDPGARTKRAAVEFDFVVTASGQTFEVEGTIEDHVLRGDVTTGGERVPLEIPLDGQALFASGFGSPLRFPLLEVGETYRFESFDPITLSANTATVFVAGDEALTIGTRQIPSRRLEVDVGGIETNAWVDMAGAVVRAETPFGLTVERLEGTALGGARETRTAPDSTVGDDANRDLLALTAIVPTGLRPFRGATEMTISLSGVDGVMASLATNTTRAQTMLDANSRVRLVRSPPGSTESTDAQPAPSHLEGDAFVQSNHEAIRARSADIVGQLERRWDKARAIHAWVNRTVEKVPILGIPSALEVLRDPRGDCNEHAVLFTALARAAGVPTRIAIGVVWSDELEAFYYHAWPEVFVGDSPRWVAMDPTLDQEVADATHLRLLDGGIESWPRLLPYLGRLQIEIEAVE